jgi:calcium-dependent protein kinase
MYGEDGFIKLIDFGLAKQSFSKNSKMTTLAGTPYYIAPEVLKGYYGIECDIWSLGVLLFLLLSGDYPFDGDNRSEVFEKIKKGKFKYENKVWNTISKEGKNLLQQMLNKDPKRRITAE